MTTIAKKFLIRNTLNDFGEIPSADCTIQYSPDIICYQNYILTYNEAVASYDKMISKPFLQKLNNYIYIRGKNNTSIPQNGEIKAFYAPLNLLYLPQNWKPLQTLDGRTVVEFRQPDKDLSEPGAIVLCQVPFCLSEVENPDLHYCMMAVSRSKEEDWPTLPTTLNGDPELWRFLREHPEVAYHNIVVKPSFYESYSEVVKIGNLNPYEEHYTIVFEVIESTFERLNIGRIEIECTYIECAFSIEITPDRASSGAASDSFCLPAQFEGDIVITYFALNTHQPVQGSIKHSYVSQNKYQMIPLPNDECSSFRATSLQGEEQTFRMNAALGSFGIVFGENTDFFNFKK